MKVKNNTLTLVVSLVALTGSLFADGFKTVSLKNAESLYCKYNYIIKTSSPYEKTYTYSELDENKDIFLEVSNKGKKIGTTEYSSSNTEGYMVFKNKDNDNFRFNIGDRMEGKDGRITYLGWYVDKIKERATNMTCIAIADK